MDVSLEYKILDAGSPARVVGNGDGGCTGWNFVHNSVDDSNGGGVRKNGHRDGRGGRYLNGISGRVIGGGENNGDGHVNCC